MAKELFGEQAGEWDAADWGCVLAGKVGGAHYLVKKMRRGEEVDMKAMGRELAHVVIAAELLAQMVGLVIECAEVERGKVFLDKSILLEDQVEIQ